MTGHSPSEPNLTELGTAQSPLAMIFFRVLRPIHDKKFQIPSCPGSAPPTLEKYRKEILKNTKEKSETGYSSFWPLKHFFWISKIVGCIIEVLTLFLTPILTYIYVKCQMSYMTYMTYVIHHMYVCQYGCQKKR